MLSQAFKLTLCSLIILTLLQNSICQKSKSKNVATAKILGSEKVGKGRSFHLTHEADYWFDLNKVMNDGKIDKIDKICVEGTWLIYDEPDFQAESKRDIGIVSGEKACVSLKKYGKVSSIQPVTAISSRKTDTLAFFPEKGFSGTAWPVDKEMKGGQMASAPKAKSLITLGKEEWTVVPEEGKPFCISPQGTSKFPVCFVSKLVDGDKVQTGRFVSIHKGCDGITKKHTIAIHFCMSYDSGKIQRIEDIANRMQGRAWNSGTKNDTEKEKEVEKVEEPCPSESTAKKIDADGKWLIETRLNSDLRANTITNWPSKISDVWKVELLERAFDVVYATCAEEFIPEDYLRLIQEVFIYQLERVWKTSKENMSRIDDDEFRALNMQLINCADLVLDNHGGILQSAVGQYMAAKSPDELLIAVDEMLWFRNDYDQVIDTVWVAMNLVAATCHHELKFLEDFWTSFINMFEKLYFKSVEKQWVKPNLWNNAYKHVLGGYGIQNSYNKLAICASIALKQIDNLDPFSRFAEVNAQLK